MRPRLISVDWGTTSLRCALVGDSGAVLAHEKSGQGILKTDGETFADILWCQIKPWLGGFEGDGPIPVLMSGMIGSRQGWLEADYLRCPASPQDLAGSLRTIETHGTDLHRCAIRIVPGMDTTDADGAPDVMRGEETQVFGALIGAGVSDGLMVLPGTHSKWVSVRKGGIAQFRTFMTGEIYAALLSATILGRLADGDAHEAAAFELGAKAAIGAQQRAAGPGDLLHMVFSARSRVLLGGLKEASVASYLSGLLIGAEMMCGDEQRAAGADVGGCGDRAPLHILADEPLRSRYAAVAALAHYDVQPSPLNPVPIAHFEIARLAGIVA